MIKLDCLTERDVQKVRIWRNIVLETLRTPYFLTQSMQENFYKNVVCNPSSNCRFFAVKGQYDVELIGMIGLTNIQWENRNAEISIIIDPEKRKKGFGSIAIDLLLEVAIQNLNLFMIYGEIYKTNKYNIEFWEKIIKKYNGYRTILQDRKYYDGYYYESIYFSINRAKYYNFVSNTNQEEKKNECKT